MKFLLGKCFRLAFGSFAAIFIFCSSSMHAVHAGSYQGIVSNVSIYNGSGWIWVSNGSSDSFGSCQGINSSANMLFFFDHTTPNGKAILTTLLTAKVTGRLVYVLGDGSCSSGSMFPGGNAEHLIGIDFKG